MENLKIKVNNEAESREIQELFFELGFGWHCGDIKDLENLNKPYLYAYDKSKGITCGSTEFYFINHENKEITLPQLCDLVVLKRNSIDDATHEFKSKRKVYVSSDDICYLFSGKKWEMFTSGSGNVAIRPIKKKEMKEYLEVKEYLNPNNNYSYHKVHAIAKGSEWIEVPEGAEILSTCSDNEKLIFWKLGFNKVVGVDSEWDGKVCSYCEFKEAYPLSVVLWQRHTKPEELPFVDDEPKQTIENTLRERQGQYGSFEDVATVTQDLLGILQRTGFNSLPKPHKEALHMICSKMARLVNGDFNHVDSWHDIGGYAKLIEDMVKSEKV